MTHARHWLLRTATAVLGWGGALLFLAGTATLTGGALLGALQPAMAIVGGGAVAMVCLVLHLVVSDSVRPRRRKRPR